MSRVAISGDASGTGTFTIASPNSNSNFTLTLPAASGTAMLTSTAVAKSQLPSGSILQIATATCDGVLSTTANGAPSTITNGVQVFSVSFTPISSTSVLWVQTSSVAISEETNSADMCWLALWDGSTFISANSGTWRFNLFTSNLNGAYISMNDGYVSGSTSARTIQVRAAMNSGSSTTYVNGNSSANYTGSSQRVRMIVWEIAA
jgi:hypothetical protein